MGQKINPISLRLQKTNRKYDSAWCSNYHYGELFLFDLKVRDYLERILKQLKYPEGRALISHFSKGSKINLFAFNPTVSRQQKSASFGLKGGVRLLRGTPAQHTLRPIGSQMNSQTKFVVVNQEGQRKVSPVLAKSLSRTNELKRPLKALSSKSRALSMYQEGLLVNQSYQPSVANSFRFTCSEKENSVLLATTKHSNTNKNHNKWNPFLPYLALSWYAKTDKLLILDKRNHGDLLGAKQQPHNTRDPLIPTSNSLFNPVKFYVQSKESKAGFFQSASGTNKSLSLWHLNGSHLGSFFALKRTLNPSYCIKAKRLRDSCFALHATPCGTQMNLQTKFAKQQVFSKTLSLWYQRGQGSTHPILLSLGADKKTIPFLTKETGCKSVAKSNPYMQIYKESKTWCESEKPRTNQDRLLKPVEKIRLSANLEQKQQSFPCRTDENSLYRCHVEGVLDQQTGSSVKLVPFIVSTERQSALFLAQEVVYFLEKRVSFRKIKDQILKELKNSKIIKGVRITCSGRVGGKSKKAQKAKTETFKQGQTSLGVFSSRIDFAQKTALTSFGLVGVKVWICFY